MELLRQRLQEVIGRKRFLLILDDVWNEDQLKWDDDLRHVWNEDQLKWDDDLRQGRSQEFVFFIIRGANHANL